MDINAVNDLTLAHVFLYIYFLAASMGLDHPVATRVSGTHLLSLFSSIILSTTNTGRLILQHVMHRRSSASEHRHLRF